MTPRQAVDSLIRELEECARLAAILQDFGAQQAYLNAANHWREKRTTILMSQPSNPAWDAIANSAGRS